MNHYNGFDGYSDLDEYGQLFGQGGFFQKVFRPQKYEAFQATQSTPLPDDFEFAEGTGVGIEVSDASEERGGFANFFKNLFGGSKERREARRTARAERAGQRALQAASRAGREVTDPNDPSYKYKRQADGTYAVFRRQPNGSFKRTGTARPGSRAYTSINALFPAGGMARDRSDRASAIAEVVGGVASAVPGILSAFGIGPKPPAVVADEGFGPELPPAKPFPWVPIGLGVGAVFLILMATRKPKTTTPATAPAPRRRRQR